MDTISIIITIYAGYLFFCFVNNCILIHFGGFENDVTKQRYMEQLWFSDALFTTYNSICEYKYANKINWVNAYLVIFVPVFNIVWLVVSLHKLNEFIKDCNDNLCEELEHNLFDQEMMFEMANLPPKRTGLKYQIWYSAKIEKHKPRIKVDLGDGKALSIQIEDHKVIGAVDKISSKDLNNILKWIDMNKELLLKYWNDAHLGTIDNGDVIDNVKKIE